MTGIGFPCLCWNISDLLSEHEERLAVDVVVCDLPGDHGVEAGEGGHQVGQPHRTQVLEVVAVQVSQLLRQEVGVLYGEGWRWESFINTHSIHKPAKSKACDHENKRRIHISKDG